MYKAVTEFRDLQDMHLYHKDDIFPYDGREIPADRIAALLNGQNKANKPLIALAEEFTVEEQKPRRRAVKTAKKAN